MNIAKLIFGGGGERQVENAKHNTLKAAPAIEPGAPAFSDHVHNPPGLSKAEEVKPLADKPAAAKPAKKPTVLFLGADVIGRVLKGREAEIVLPEDIREKDERQALDEHLSARIVEHTDSAAKDAWKLHQRKIVESTALGEKLVSDAWTLEDFREDFSQKRRHLKEARRANRAGMAGVAARIIPRIEAIAKAQAEQLEATERATAAEWGVAFEPSPILIRVQYLSENARQLFSDPSAIPPKMVFHQLGINL